ncbi:unnamed protein product [Moneuplotes crassus]|uniref:Uncharacterized protein n=1 Tax=Euplotes crassus TaxID=5936 RepID=A0AAD1Y1I6_EUPCR|nr:unnamed protein product [Moneuplotes crassus]
MALAELIPIITLFFLLLFFEPFLIIHIDYEQLEHMSHLILIISCAVPGWIEGDKISSFRHSVIKVLQQHFILGQDKLQVNLVLRLILKSSHNCIDNRVSSSRKVLRILNFSALGSPVSLDISSLILSEAALISSCSFCCLSSISLSSSSVHSIISSKLIPSIKASAAASAAFPGSSIG